MKIPKCHCGSISGWLNDLQCNLCGCWPWQHSSNDEDEYEYDSSNQDSDEERLEFARNKIKLEIHEEKIAKIDHINRAIFAGRYCQKADEDRFLMLHSMWEQDKKRKKKRFRTRRFRNNIRKAVPPFTIKDYHLDVYKYYRSKEIYDEEILLDYFKYLGLDEERKTKEYLDAGLEPTEINLTSYEDFLKQ